MAKEKDEGIHPRLDIVDFHAIELLTERTASPLDRRVRSQGTTVTLWHARPGLQKETISKLLLSGMSKLMKANHHRQNV